MTGANRRSVTIAEIDAQRVAGWPDFHPETFCHRCGGKNPVWSVDSDRWVIAEAMFEDDVRGGIVCPGCFVDRFEAATGQRCCWKLVPGEHMHPLYESYAEMAALYVGVAAAMKAQHGTPRREQ